MELLFRYFTSQAYSFQKFYNQNFEMNNLNEKRR